MLFSKSCSKSSRRSQGGVLTSLTLSIAVVSAALLPAAPAEASEVVKLARLVITGKRLSAMPQHRATLEQLPRVVLQGQSEAQSEKPVALARVAESKRAHFQPI